MSIRFLAFPLSAFVLAGCSGRFGPVVNHYDTPPFPPDFPALRSAEFVTGDALTVAATNPAPFTWCDVTWDAYATPASFNVYTAATVRGPWALLTNTTANAVRVPLGEPCLLFWVTATNAGRESPRPRL